MLHRIVLRDAALKKIVLGAGIYDGKLVLERNTCDKSTLADVSLEMRKYSNTQIAYHWLTLSLVLFLIGSGLAFSFKFAGAGSKTLIAHQISGQALIVLLAFRIVARLTRKTPDTVLAHAKWEQKLAGATHLGLYAALIAYVISGYVSASGMVTNALIAPINIGVARSDIGEVFVEAHYAMKWVLLGLFGLHLTGALKHVFFDRDGTMSLMRFTSSK